MESNISGINLNLTDVIGKAKTNINETTSYAVNSTTTKKINELEELQKVSDVENKRSEVNEKNTEIDLAAAIEVISSFIEPQLRNVNFTQDESSGKTVVKVFDTKTQELIKQFPSEEVLELSEKIKGLQNEVANKTGLLIDDKV